MSFEERCPCGNNIKLSGSTYGGVVSSEIQRWHRVHDKHASAIAKALAENVRWPIYYVPPMFPMTEPQPWWQNPIITFNDQLKANQGGPSGG